MESPPPVVDAPARRNRTPYTIALVALVLCGCCIALIIAGYYYYRQNILTVPDLSTETAPTPVPVPTDASILPTSAPSGDVGEPPEGGLTDDALRHDTWQYVAFAAIGLGCDQPIGGKTQIEVLQQPVNGAWIEKWTVVCASGDKYPYEIEYVPGPAGTGPTFNVKSVPE